MYDPTYMPLRRPVRTWTPPAGKRADSQPARRSAPDIRNARRRRAMRNGWSR